MAALKEVRKRIPRGVLEWVQDFDTALEPELAADQQFDFRVYLVPHTGPKTKADAAMTFVKMDVLDDQQRRAVEHVQTIIREKQVPVAGLNDLRPAQVAERVAEAIGAQTDVEGLGASIWVQ